MSRELKELFRDRGASGTPQINPVEAIAGEIGYEDASFFSRPFRRKVELTPVQYRKRFGALRKALQSGAF